MTDTSFDIAVVGLALRCPGARGENDFWRLVASGRDAVERFPDEHARLPAALRSLGAGAPYVPAGENWTTPSASTPTSSATRPVRPR